MTPVERRIVHVCEDWHTRKWIAAKVGLDRVTTTALVRRLVQAQELEEQGHSPLTRKALAVFRRRRAA